MRLLPCASLAVLLLCPAGSARPQTAGRSETKMMQARGTFQVKIKPRSIAPEGFDAMALDKTYTGALEATATGEMLSAGDPAAGNAGYVAMERIVGKLDGRGGSFVLMQSALMATGLEPKMTVTIVPGSGTGELSGIYGSMTIVIAGGNHSYTVDYAFSR